MFFTDAIKKLEAKTNINEMQEGEFKVTPLCVCKSAAGFYIGSWCIERDGGQFFPQPYSRESEYFSTFEEAEEALPFFLYP